MDYSSSSHTEQIHGSPGRAYWFDPVAGEVTLMPDAPYGWVIEPPDGRPRPATKEEAEGHVSG